MSPGGVALLNRGTLVRVFPRGRHEAADFLRRQPWVPGFARIELEGNRITVTIRSRSYLFDLLPVVSL